LIAVAAGTDPDAAPAAPGLAYHPALDGLRAIAVIAVVAYHFGWIRGGFLGVDLFFVLSGFLITSLLVGERSAHGRVDLVGFWARRARRLLPALLLLIAVLLVVARASTPRSDVFATLGYVANWHQIWSQASYFDAYRAPSPLRHAWSLGVEEQFYLLWPILVVAAFRLGGRRALAIACGAGIVASVTLMAIWYRPADPSRVYYGADTRAHLLLVGALLALVPWRRWPQWFGALSLAVCAITMLIATDHSIALYRGGMFVNALLVAAVIGAIVSRPDARLARSLGARPLRDLGRVSYGVYLWSWPVIVLCTTSRTGLSGAPLTALRLALIAGATVASYFLVEQPIRMTHGTSRRILWNSGIALAGVALVAAIVVPVAKPNRVFVSDGPSLAELASRSDATAAAPAPPVHVSPRAPHRVAIVGDSIAASLGWGMNEVALEFGIEVERRAIAGCGIAVSVPIDDRGEAYPWGDDCAKSVPWTLDDVIATSDPDVVVWLSSLDLVDRYDTDGKTILHWGEPAHRQALLAAMDDARLRLTARGARIVMIAPPPPTVVDDYPPYSDEADARLHEFRDLLFDYVAQHRDQMSIVDLQPSVCPDGFPCPVEIDGARLRPDGAHFSETTARIVAREILPSILTAARAQ
jgi:peptidoglycan/LPS O-acetylase OafA/YrhL